MVVMVISLFGFTLFAVTLYPVKFKTFTKSFMSLTRLLSGGYEFYNDLYVGEIGIAVLFIFVEIVFNLVLAKVAIAIYYSMHKLVATTTTTTT